MHRLLLGLVGALVLAAGLAGPAAAYQTVSETGAHGSVWLDDNMTTPGGTCSYGEFVYSNWSYLEWMKVRAPHVFAADRVSGKREHRTVTWQWKLQRHAYADPQPLTGWKTVASSRIQRATAYEDAQAPFTALTVNFNARSHSPAPPTYNDSYLRALVIVKWLRADGSVEATVKLIPDNYRMKTTFRPDYVTSSAHCQFINTSG